MNNEKIIFQCIKVDQPIGSFYVGVINYRDLIDISYADVRRLEKQERDVETYIGIQRPLSLGRVKEISRYVNLVDATFPTSIILAVSSENVDYDDSRHEMKITKDSKVAKVLDGQHRIAGLEGCKYDNEKFQINVVIFVDMELEDQAIVFATINKSHAKVNKSLVADLFDFAMDRSPQKTVHNIVRALNEKEGSPFYEKIKILGAAEDKEKETITQATFVDSLLKYISGNDLCAMNDRDLYKRGSKPDKVMGAEQCRLFLRNMFIDEKDIDIAQIIWNYFSAVGKKWPAAWNNTQQSGLVLNRSTGFIALMRFLKPAYLSFGKFDYVPSKEEFSSIFSKIKLDDDDFTREAYLPGTAGQSRLYNELISGSGLGS